MLNTAQYQQKQQKNPKVEDGIQKFKTYIIKKGTNGLKVKNDNGLISVLICYCTAPR